MLNIAQHSSRSRLINALEKPQVGGFLEQGGVDGSGSYTKHGCYFSDRRSGVVSGTVRHSLLSFQFHLDSCELNGQTCQLPHEYGIKATKCRVLSPKMGQFELESL